MWKNKTKKYVVVSSWFNYPTHTLHLFGSYFLERPLTVRHRQAVKHISLFLTQDKTIFLLNFRGRSRLVDHG